MKFARTLSPFVPTCQEQPESGQSEMTFANAFSPILAFDDVSSSPKQAISVMPKMNGGEDLFHTVFI
jgi:hypothetical protein